MKLEADLLVENAAQGVTLKASPGSTDAEGKLGVIPDGTVALATDFNPGSCLTESLPLITTIACTPMRMTPAEAILGITLHAARALRQEKGLGRLDPGKQADLVVLDIPDYRHLSYHFGVNHVWKVIKKGRLAWEAESAHSTIRVDPR